MEKMLLVKVRFLDDRYYGEGDWPPAPARLFQALVAGNAVGAVLPEECAESLRWLESLPPPEIRAQRGWWGLRYTTFVPNNDLDAKGGDPTKVTEIRVGKTMRPHHIDARNPVCYAWRCGTSPNEIENATRLSAMVGNVYQLGRGVDVAWAVAELLDTTDGEAALDATPGEIFRAGTGSGEVQLDCPSPGSLDSLLVRFQARCRRFSSVHEGKKVKVLFANPPKARFSRVTYNPAWHWRLFDLCDSDTGQPFRAWPLTRAVKLTTGVRDALAQRLAAALPEQLTRIERLVVGRDASAMDKEHRVRLIPLPSIGNEQTHQAIRRLLLMVPSASPLPIGDLEWALSGLLLEERETARTVLVRSDNSSMLGHYGLESGESYRRWRSITPVALPTDAARRRVDPDHRLEQAKGGLERALEEQQACAAVAQSLRHAGVRNRVETIHVQREPFIARGERVEAFAAGTRFPKERLWHVELSFTEPQEGPLIIGDGRFLGLGLLAPVKEPVGILAYQIESGLFDRARPEPLAQALRRAVMARIQVQLGAVSLPPFFTGHAADGSPLREGDHRHLSFVADLPRKRLLVVAPHLLEGRTPRGDEQNHLDQLDLAMRDMCLLTTGEAGCLELFAVPVDLDRDPLFRPSRHWETLSLYRPTRHAKRLTPVEALMQDVLREVERSHLPVPRVEVFSVREGPRGGLEGRVRLEFPYPQSGPLMLGRSRHVGGGLFGAV